MYIYVYVYVHMYVYSQAAYTCLYIQFYTRKLSTTAYVGVVVDKLLVRVRRHIHQNNIRTGIGHTTTGRALSKFKKVILSTVFQVVVPAYVVASAYGSAHEVV